MDANEQLTELDRRLKRGEIRLPEYFQLRSQLLPDPSLADASTTYPPVENADPSTAYLRVENADTVPPPVETVTPPAADQRAAASYEPYQARVDEQPEDFPAAPRNGQPSPDVDLTMPRSSVQYQPPSPTPAAQPWGYEVPDQPASWSQQPHAEFQQPPAWLQRPAPSRSESAGPAVSDPSPWTQPRVAIGKSLTRKRRRNTVVAGLVVVLLVAVVGTWLVTKGGKSDNRPNATTGSPFDPNQQLVNLDGLHNDSNNSGPASVADAVKRSLTYPDEVTKLNACGAGTGTTQVATMPDWFVGGSAFPCRDSASAHKVASEMETFEQTKLRFTRIDAQVPVFYKNNPAAVAKLPAEFHIRYVSGSVVISMIVHATSEATGKAAVDVILGAMLITLPVS